MRTLGVILAVLVIVGVAGAAGPATNLDIASYSAKAVTIRWTPATEATGYRLYKDGVFVSTAGAGATTAKFGNLTWAPHTFGVEPTVNGGFSTITVAPRWIETGSTEPKPPPPPTDPPPSPGGCSKTVSSTATLNADLAVAGAVVCLTSGSYGAVTLTAAPSSPATLQSAPGATVAFTGRITVFGSRLTLTNMRIQDIIMGNYDDTPGRPNANTIVLDNLTGRNFQVSSASNITIRGGSWGPASSCGGPNGGGNNSIRQNVPSVTPSNILITDTVIHDVQSYNLINCHTEGLAIFAGSNVTVRNTKFYGNSIYDIFIQANSGGSPTGLTFQGNWMAAPLDNSGANGKPVGTPNGPAIGFSGITANVTFKGNRLNTYLSLDDNGLNPTFTNFIVADNVGAFPYSGAPCGRGIVFTNNLWKNNSCGPTDGNLNGAAYPYVRATNDSTLDYTLTP